MWRAAAAPLLRRAALQQKKHCRQPVGQAVITATVRAVQRMAAQGLCLAERQPAKVAVAVGGGGRAAATA